MTNDDDAELLRSEAYRAECAEELARGVCEYFSGAYVREVPATSEKPSNGVRVIADQVEVKKGLIIDDSVYVPLRAVGEALGAHVAWSNATKTATLTSK